MATINFELNQERGLGGLLLKAAEKNARKLASRSISKVTLTVLETNAGAQRCYTKAGSRYAQLCIP